VCVVDVVVKTLNPKSLNPFPLVAKPFLGRPFSSALVAKPLLGRPLHCWLPSHFLDNLLTSGCQAYSWTTSSLLGNDPKPETIRSTQHFPSHPFPKTLVIVIVVVSCVCVCCVCVRSPLKLRQELTDIALGLGRTAENANGITTALRPALQQTGGGETLNLYFRKVGWVGICLVSAHLLNFACV
jgi:hypothetical protein